MTTIRHEQLESPQEYSRQGNFGFKRMDDYQNNPEQGFICSLCQEAEVKDEGDYCPSCQVEEDEYRSDQEADR